MAVYVMADLHLSFGEVDKPMDVFGGAWVGYMDRIKESWENTVGPEDTVIVPGDISWAMKLKDSLEDLKFLDSLPGNKILLKGNHDYWWDTVAKMQRFLLDHDLNSIKILYNNAYEVEDYILCGTRLWDSVGSSSEAADRKAYLRELGRLKMSLDKGVALQKASGVQSQIVVFTHFPPTATYDGVPEFMNLLKEYRVEKCYYGHIHGVGILQATQGDVNGVELKLVSADALGFVPYRVGV